MADTRGIQVLGDYTTGSPTNKQRVARLRALLGDPSTPPGMVNPPNGAGFLDEMSPVAHAQLRVELAALEAAIVNA